MKSLSKNLSVQIYKQYFLYENQIATENQRLKFTTVRQY